MNNEGQFHHQKRKRLSGRDDTNAFIAAAGGSEVKRDNEVQDEVESFSSGGEEPSLSRRDASRRRRRIQTNTIHYSSGNEEGDSNQESMILPTEEEEEDSKLPSLSAPSSAYFMNNPHSIYANDATNLTPTSLSSIVLQRSSMRDPPHQHANASSLAAQSRSLFVAAREGERGVITSPSPAFMGNSTLLNTHAITMANSTLPASLFQEPSSRGGMVVGSHASSSSLLEASRTSAASPAQGIAIPAAPIGGSFPRMPSSFGSAMASAADCSANSAHNILRSFSAQRHLNQALSALEQQRRISLMHAATANTQVSSPPYLGPPSSSSLMVDHLRNGPAAAGRAATTTTGSLLGRNITMTIPGAPSSLLIQEHQHAAPMTAAATRDRVLLSQLVGGGRMGGGTTSAGKSGNSLATPSPTSIAAILAGERHEREQHLLGREGRASATSGNPMSVDASSRPLLHHPILDVGRGTSRAAGGPQRIRTTPAVELSPFLLLGSNRHGSTNVDPASLPPPSMITAAASVATDLDYQGQQQRTTSSAATANNGGRLTMLQQEDEREIARRALVVSSLPRSCPLPKTTMQKAMMLQQQGGSSGAGAGDVSNLLVPNAGRIVVAPSTRGSSPSSGMMMMASNLSRTPTAEGVSGTSSSMVSGGPATAVGAVAAIGTIAGTANSPPLSLLSSQNHPHSTTSGGGVSMGAAPASSILSRRGASSPLALDHRGGVAIPNFAGDSIVSSHMTSASGVSGSFLANTNVAGREATSMMGRGGTSTHPMYASSVVASIPPGSAVASSLVSSPAAFGGSVSSIIQGGSPALAVAAASSFLGAPVPAAILPTMGHQEQQQRTNHHEDEKVASSSCLFAVDLYMRCDEEVLSDHQILLRKQIEVFAAGEDEAQRARHGRRRKITTGQVGLRCKHCAVLSPQKRPKGAVYYPATLRALYQAAQNMAASHFVSSCQQISTELKEQLRAFQQAKSTAGHGGKKYWSDGARALGVVETENGLSFNNRSEDPHTNSTASSSREQSHNHGDHKHHSIGACIRQGTAAAHHEEDSISSPDDDSSDRTL